MKYLVSVLMCVCLSSCAIQNLVNDTYYSNVLIEKTDIFYPSDFNVEEISNTDDIVNWMKERIEYVADAKTWKSTEQTLLDGYGDCKQFSNVFMNLYYIKYGIKTTLAFSDYYTRAIDNGGEANHSIVILDNNTKLEPQTGKLVQDSICYYYSFDEVFN